MNVVMVVRDKGQLFGKLIRDLSIVAGESNRPLDGVRLRVMQKAKHLLVDDSSADGAQP